MSMKVGEQVWYDSRLRIVHVLEDVWLLDDADDGSAYVVVGKEKALVIDTCNGEQDFLAAVRTLTDLPVILVNTHAHPDHVGGNRFFEKALIGEEELPEYNTTYQAPCPVDIIRDGDLLDLGGKVIRAIAFPGHTPGGICLLDEADRVLFTGDSVLGRTVWMFMKNSVPIATMKQSLLNLNTYRDRFDHLLTGHSRRVDDPVYIDRLIEACDTILAGAPAERFGAVSIWGGDWKTCFYTGEDGMQATLVFKPDHLR